MAVLTGADGALRFRGVKIGRVRDWNLTINRDALEDTCLGAVDRTYVGGLRGASGSATVLYDAADTDVTSLLNSIFEDDTQSSDIEFVLNARDRTELGCRGFITSVGHSVSVGAVQAANISFQVSGAIAGGF